jgi:hypothetical protein
MTTHNSHNQTAAHKTHNHIYSDTKWNQKNMTECDKPNSHISSKLRMSYISSDNDWHPVTKTFTPLRYICRHFTSSHLNLLYARRLSLITWHLRRWQQSYWMVHLVDRSTAAVISEWAFVLISNTTGMLHLTFFPWKVQGVIFSFVRNGDVVP